MDRSEGRVSRRRRRIVVRVAAIALSLSAVACAHSNELRMSGPQSDFQMVNNDLRDRDVEVRTTSGDLFPLSDVRLSNSVLVGGATGDETPFVIDLPEVSEFSYKTRWGSLFQVVGIGAGVGALVGAFSFDESLCEGGPLCSRGYSVSLGGVLGALTGAAVAPLIGGRVRYVVVP